MDERDSEFPVWFVDDDEGREGNCDCSLGELEYFRLRIRLLVYNVSFQISCRVMIQMLCKVLTLSEIGVGHAQG